MRILNRPMFRYGGPIKEGVMHGMRDGGRAALVGNPVYPQTGGREHHNIIKSVPKYIKPGYWASLGKQGTLGGKVKNWWQKIKPTAVPSRVQTNVGMGGVKLTPAQIKAGMGTKGIPFAERAGSWVRKNPWWTAGGVGVGSQYAGDAVVGGAKLGEKAVLQAADLLVRDKWFDQDKWMKENYPKGFIGGLFGDKEIKTPPPEIKSGSRWKDMGTAPIITASQREKLAKDAQNKRLKSYLDMMGYDSAKKGALSDALIDASALVQDATTEAGSLKKADWGKLINRMIQTTSKRLDKPEQIREAVGLMMTKGEIEKDIAAGKGGPLKQNARDLVAAGVYKTEKEAMAHLGKKAGFEEVVGALSAKKDVDGKVLADAWRISGEGIPTEQVKGSNKYYKNFKEKKEDEGKGTNIELAFVDEEIDDKQPGDVYVIDDRMIVVQEDGTLKYRW